MFWNMLSVSFSSTDFVHTTNQVAGQKHRHSSRPTMFMGLVSESIFVIRSQVAFLNTCLDQEIYAYTTQLVPAIDLLVLVACKYTFRRYTLSKVCMNECKPPVEAKQATSRNARTLFGVRTVHLRLNAPEKCSCNNTLCEPRQSWSITPNV